MGKTFEARDTGYDCGEKVELTGFVVADPGARPEMPMIAAGLARAGLLRALIAPFGGPPNDLRAAAPSWMPSWAQRRLATELRRRELPSAISASSVDHTCSVLDALTAAAGRMPISRAVAPSLVRLRDAVFDRAVARRLQSADDGVVTVAGAAERTLSAAMHAGVTSFLECPIAHHRAIRRLLREEAKLQPEYASTLQLHDLPHRLERRLEQEIRLADRLLVLSSYQRQTFVDEGVDPKKILLVPLGVDTQVFRPSSRPTDPIFRVIFAGQITQRKGISYLINAFRSAQISSSELLLLGRIVGTDTPWRHYRGVRHVDHVPRWELPEYYGVSDVYVLPSLVEGFGLTAIEAMSCGIPVIVSDHTFGRDVVTDGKEGFVVPIRDTAALAERLTYLFENPDERRTMGLAARARAEELSWEQYGEAIVSALTTNTMSSVTSHQMTEPTAAE